uniref:Uncharacterized protein n=1 Tax=Cacopsylla melanoneura TaxID=428564 RepID=A0A8D8S320_9HEMI
MFVTTLSTSKPSSPSALITTPNFALNALIIRRPRVPWTPGWRLLSTASSMRVLRPSSSRKRWALHSRRDGWIYLRRRLRNLMTRLVSSSTPYPWQCPQFSPVHSGRRFSVPWSVCIILSPCLITFPWHSVGSTWMTRTRWPDC